VTGVIAAVAADALDAPLTSCACAIPATANAPMQTEASNREFMTILVIGVPS